MSTMRKLAVACGAAAAVAGLGAGVASASPIASGGCWCAQGAHATALVSTKTTATVGAESEGPGSRGVVAANGVRIRQWPKLNAPVLGYAWRDEEVGVLAWYSDFDEILYRGREAWIASQFVYSDGLTYTVRVPAPTH